MKLQGEVKQNLLIVTIEGDLIGENSGAEIVGYITDNLNDDLKSCALNLNEVRYMNSSGIGVLITLLTKITGKDGLFMLIDPSDQVQKLLQITKLSEVFIIVKDEEEALASTKK